MPEHAPAADADWKLPLQSHADRLGIGGKVVTRPDPGEGWSRYLVRWFCKYIILPLVLIAIGYNLFDFEMDENYMGISSREGWALAVEAVGLVAALGQYLLDSDAVTSILNTFSEDTEDVSPDDAAFGFSPTAATSSLGVISVVFEDVTMSKVNPVQPTSATQGSVASSQPTSKPTIRPASTPLSKPVSEPANNSVSKPINKPSSKPATKPVTKSANQPSALPTPTLSALDLSVFTTSDSKFKLPPETTTYLQKHSHISFPKFAKCPDHGHIKDVYERAMACLPRPGLTAQLSHDTLIAAIGQAFSDMYACAYSKDPDTCLGPHLQRFLALAQQRQSTSNELTASVASSIPCLRRVYDETKQLAASVTEVWNKQARTHQDAKDGTPRVFEVPGSELAMTRRELSAWLDAEDVCHLDLSAGKDQMEGLNKTLGVKLMVEEQGTLVDVVQQKVGEYKISKGETLPADVVWNLFDPVVKLLFLVDKIDVSEPGYLRHWEDCWKDWIRGGSRPCEW